MPRRPTLPAPIQLAWLIVKPAKARSAEEAAVILHIEQDDEAATLVRLVHRFVDLVRDAGVTTERCHTGVETLDTWLADVQGCGIYAVVTFAAAT